MLLAVGCLMTNVMAELLTSISVEACSGQDCSFCYLLLAPCG